MRASELRANHLRPRSSAAYRKLLGIEINMAGCARTAALAQRQQIVEAMVADDLHCRHPRCPRNLADFAVARSYDQCPHDNFPLSISRPFRQTKPAWRQSRWAVNGTADVRNAVWRRRSPYKLRLSALILCNKISLTHHTPTFFPTPALRRKVKCSVSHAFSRLLKIETHAHPHACQPQKTALAKPSNIDAAFRW